MLYNITDGRNWFEIFVKVKDMPFKDLNMKVFIPSPTESSTAFWLMYFAFHENEQIHWSWSEPGMKKQILLLLLFFGYPLSFHLRKPKQSLFRLLDGWLAGVLNRRLWWKAEHGRLWCFSHRMPWISQADKDNLPMKISLTLIILWIMVWQL